MSIWVLHCNYESPLLRDSSSSGSKKSTTVSSVKTDSEPSLSSHPKDTGRPSDESEGVPGYLMDPKDVTMVISNDAASMIISGKPGAVDEPAHSPQNVMIRVGRVALEKLKEKANASSDASVDVSDVVTLRPLPDGSFVMQIKYVRGDVIVLSALPFMTEKANVIEILKPYADRSSVAYAIPNLFLHVEDLYNATHEAPTPGSPVGLDNFVILSSDRSITCAISKPANATFTVSTATGKTVCSWNCDSGFEGAGNECTQIQSPIQCGIDFYLSGSSCLPVGVGYFSSGDNLQHPCTNKPAHASYTGSGNGQNNCPIACDSGFENVGSGCYQIWSNGDPAKNCNTLCNEKGNLACKGTSSVTTSIDGKKFVRQQVVSSPPVCPAVSTDAPYPAIDPEPGSSCALNAEWYYDGAAYCLWKGAFCFCE